MDMVYKNLSDAVFVDEFFFSDIQYRESLWNEFET